MMINANDLKDDLDGTTQLTLRYSKMHNHYIPTPQACLLHLGQFPIPELLILEIQVPRDLNPAGAYGVAPPFSPDLKKVGLLISGVSAS
jgi:hypothetical protein